MNDILKLIEQVDPADTAKLDEIDIRTLCWLDKREWGGWHGKPGGSTGSWGLDSDGNRIPNSYVNHSSFERISRSRDALKAIRPEGWVFCICPEHGNVWMVHFTNDEEDLQTLSLPTEELAELHAIIQAIEYERSQ